VGAAVGAELARHRRREVLRWNGLAVPLVYEKLLGHAHHDVRMAARDVLALAAVTLALKSASPVAL
jgi:hypothetical protein